MGRPEGLALSLGLSLALAAAAWGLMTLFERRPSDPALRERGWALALYLPVLPIGLVVMTLLLPPLALPSGATPQAPAGAAAFVVEAVFHRGLPGLRPDALAAAALGLAGLLGAARAGRLLLRTLNLGRFLRSTQAAPADLIAVVETVARRTGVPTPRVRIAGEGAEAMIVGLFHPVLILPAALIGAPALEAVCAHELAHLRRGDHRALWVEEVLLSVMAFNPVLGLIRVRRAAAREEACDAEVLRHAGDAARRLYARSLVDALRASPHQTGTPALTFTSSRRILVMRRLKAVLSPVPVSGARHRLTVLGAGLALAAVTGAASVALAGQRAPEPRAPAAAAPVVTPVARPLPTVSARPVATPVAAPAPVARPKAQPRPTPVAAPIETPEAPITNPSWVQSPRPTWPQAAGADVASGSATVSCTARADGRLTDCAVLSEDPVGAGFGPAAVDAAQAARLTPSMIDAGAAGRRIQFMVRFRLG